MTKSTPTSHTDFKSLQKIVGNEGAYRTLYLHTL